jgi:hypothetical protein
MSLRIRDVQIENTGIPRRIGVAPLKARKGIIKVSDQGKDSGEVQNPTQKLYCWIPAHFYRLEILATLIGSSKKLKLKNSQLHLPLRLFLHVTRRFR